MMAAGEARQSGFDCEFVEQPQKAFQVDCPICLSVLREPYQVSCCGYNYCRFCIECVHLQKSPCPTCSETGFSVFPNKGLKRSLCALHVHCSHKKKGCQWTGELGELEQHVSQDCLLNVGSCDFRFAGCEVQLPRRDMAAHLAESVVVHMSLLASHGRRVSELNDKKLSEKDEQIARLRDELGEKLEENRQKIEALEQENEALRRCLKEQTKEMDQKLEPVLPSLPVEFTMNDFDRYKKNKRAWYSPPFYTHPQGYKLSLKVIPNIRGDPTAMYVGAFLMRGELDHLLKWPFEGSIALEMLNQLEDSEHFKFRAVFIGTQRAYRLRDSDRAERGRGNDVLYEKMNYNPTKHCQYLKDNCLHFRVTQFINRNVIQLQRQCLAMESRVCVCPIEFTMTDFECYKEHNDRWLSPSFYTHAEGYRMCLAVFANGHRGTHIALFVHLMRGLFDNSLKWPFQGVITIQLLNQRGSGTHHEQQLVFTSHDRANRVTAQVMDERYGFDRFISQDRLGYNQATDSQYLYNDCLRFRLTAQVK